MKKLITFVAMLAVALTGCSKDDTEPQGNPSPDNTIVFDDTTFAFTTTDVVGDVTSDNVSSVQTLEVTAAADLSDLCYFSGLTTLTIGSSVEASELDLAMKYNEISTFANLESLTILTNTISTLDISATSISSASSISVTSGTLTTLYISEAQSQNGDLCTALKGYINSDGGIIYTKVGEEITQLYPALDSAMAFDDENFKAFVIAAYNAENSGATISGEITYAQAATIATLDVDDSISNNAVSGVKEIRWLVGLTKLTMQYTDISSLDLTYNTELTDVSLMANFNLTTTNVTFARSNKVTTLNITQSEFVDIPANLTGITALTAQSCIRLTSLDLSAYTELRTVDLWSSNVETLTGLGSSIEGLYIKYTEITTLDISATSISLSYDISATSDTFTALYISEAQYQNEALYTALKGFTKSDGGSIYIAGNEPTLVYPSPSIL